MSRSVAPTLSARSVVLSLLLGSHPHRMSPAALTRAGEHFGIPASTMRVALTRAVAAGDLVRTDPPTGSGQAAYYVLGERHVRRQRRQDEAVDDAETPWDGTWEMAIVVVAGRSGADRAALRELLSAYRLGELREGVWTRPANLRRPRGYAEEPVLRTFDSTP
ncbi:MAG TPA: PaaX domain-containing protein, C- domain protein, partial [Microbacterium sp.]|nr:PaaX domain-containing protein, C- domain protein [Microbacterium sp.]